MESLRALFFKNVVYNASPCSTIAKRFFSKSTIYSYQLYTAFRSCFCLMSIGWWWSQSTVKYSLYFELQELKNGNNFTMCFVLLSNRCYGLKLENRASFEAAKMYSLLTLGSFFFENKKKFIPRSKDLCNENMSKCFLYTFLGAHLVGLQLIYYVPNIDNHLIAYPI